MDQTINQVVSIGVRIAIGSQPHRKSRRSQQEKMKNTLRIWFCAALASLSMSAYGKISLSVEDADSWMNELTVKLATGEEASFTLLKDTASPRQFYYVPDQPRLARKKVNGREEPEFHLVTYEYPDPTNPARLIRGGTVQFAVSSNYLPKRFKV